MRDYCHSSIWVLLVRGVRYELQVIEHNKTVHICKRTCRRKQVWLEQQKRLDKVVT